MTASDTHPAVAVFCGKSIQTIFHDKGTQSWVVDRARAQKLPYAILIRNHGEEWADKTQPHGTAFMVVKIKGVIGSSEPHCPERWNILFDEYADINIPKAWKGDRNPVRYSTLEDFGVRFEDLVWKKRPDVEAPVGPVPKEPTEVTAIPQTVPEIVAYYRDEIATRIGVKPEAVRISIDF